ncbi:hypothetical protein LX64_05065 [Chitinophaga skermanii]|uniref:Lipoprotein n=1 Tax=Chitinophaga skermanii TaxID=331697 RepID=A0A327Q1C6_9BACT|nr:hypothetical protein [Chitinophaga skermanii]RAI97557.1 hypothetical protein LX64_05065 [Chitinophaga skermanii]
MKNLSFAAILLMTACQATTTTSTEPTTTPTEAAPVGAAATPPSNANKVGEEVHGDFNGDGKPETAYVVQTAQAEGNPVEDGKPANYEVRFSDESMPNINIGCCESLLINEGDLNGDGKDELSTYQAPMNGNTYAMKTYSFHDKNWKTFIDTFLIPTGGEELTLDALEQRIVLENGKVYYYDVDVNDENFQLVKKPAKTM